MGGEGDPEHALLAWYDAHAADARDLPWRRDRDPYKVLVSEIMLQQTRTETVRRYFERWIGRWPTAADLAAATDEEVMAAWSGLGYYGRARRLHEAAKRIASDGWPDDLTKLPGVGPYTAGAVASIAFDHVVPAIDGNVKRVMARLFRIDLDLGTAAGRRAIAAQAAVLVDPERPGDWNQAVMELGATVCTPTPRCSDCPISAQCKSYGLDPEAFPVRAAKPKPLAQDVHVLLADRGDAVWMVKRGPGLLAGTWGLPETAPTPQQAAGPVLGVVDHVFTHRRWRLHVHAIEPANIEPASGDEERGQWVGWNELDQRGISTAFRKALAVARQDL